MKEVVLFLSLIIASVAGYMYLKIYAKPAYFVDEFKLTKIKSDLNFDELVSTLIQDSVIRNKEDITLVSKLMGFDSRKSFPSGLYRFEKSNTVRELITILRSGRQTPINITFNSVRKVDELCGVIGEQIEVDSTELASYLFNQDNLDKWGYSKHNILSLFIPNTYEIFWNISKEKLIDRFVTENAKFWNTDNRKDKLEELGYSPAEVYTLASIVEKESNVKSERPTIAGVYLNRLDQGILLQADPTVVFASGQFDLRRVLNKHLAIDSPFNTYKYAGLPPGPICMPSISSIDAVLNAEKHDYLFFCAKPGYGQLHSFAKNLRQHNNNARKYRDWLRKERIK